MQSCLVLNALQQHQPAQQLTLYTRVNPAFLRSRLDRPFAQISVATDFGMLMQSAVDIDVAASHQRYQQTHQNWSQQLADTAKQLEQLKPDLIFADVPYLLLAAAKLAQIPAVALCSLNWADIYWHYCQTYPQAKAIHQQILNAYQSANAFLQPRPHMPMLDLDNRQSIGVLARLGKAQRQNILQQLALPGDTRLILVGLGGIDMHLPVQNWPLLANTHWLVPPTWQTQRSDMQAFDSLGVEFIDLLSSCDLLLTKPGYGSFTEAACNGIPVLYLEREDWPETPYLTQWLHQHAAALSVSRRQLETGDLQASIEQVLALPRPPRPLPSGAEEAAKHLSRYGVD